MLSCILIKFSHPTVFIITAVTLEDVEQFPDAVWAGCHDFFYAVNEVLGDVMSISYREIEPSCHIFFVHERASFLQKGAVSHTQEVHLMICVMTLLILLKMSYRNGAPRRGVERVDKPEEEMMDYINRFTF